MQKSGKSYGQAGSVITIVAIVFLAVALVAAIGFGVWANNGRKDYKNNSDQKVAIAVDAAKKAATAAQKDADAQLAKSPVLTFTGPTVYGAVKYDYPRTWDGYVDTTSTSTPINGVYYQGAPPLPNDLGIFYALRVNEVSDDYSSVVNSFNGAVKKGTVTATAYVPPQMVGKPNVQTGTRFDGLLGNNIQGAMVVLKVRDRTLKISTESPQYLNDFNNTVLPSLTYVP